MAVHYSASSQKLLNANQGGSCSVKKKKGPGETTHETLPILNASEEGFCMKTNSVSIPENKKRSSFEHDMMSNTPLWAG